MNSLKKIGICTALLISSSFAFNTNMVYASNYQTGIQQYASIPSGYKKLKDLASAKGISVTWIASSNSIRFSGGAMSGSKTLTLDYLKQNYGAYTHTDNYTYMSPSSFSDVMFFEFNIQ